MNENLSMEKIAIPEDYKWCDCLIKCAVCGLPCCSQHAISISKSDASIVRYWCSVSCVSKDSVLRITAVLAEA